MASATDPQPLADDEILFRRIPAKPEFYDPVGGIRELAVKPTQNDTDGLSLSRECVGPAGTAATGPAGREFFVASFRVSELIGRIGLTVVADRDDHAVITDLTHDLRRSKDPAVGDRLTEMYKQLVRAVVEVTGPFPGKAPPTAPPSPA